MSNWIVPFRIFGYVVVLLMALSMAYAAYISVQYWAGIGV